MKNKRLPGLILINIGIVIFIFGVSLFTCVHRDDWIIHDADYTKEIEEGVASQPGTPESYPYKDLGMGLIIVGVISIIIGIMLALFPHIIYKNLV